VASEDVSPRSRDFERLLTFVDAVVAIAITLLVLPLVDVAGEAQQGSSVSELLDAHLPELYAFVLSFAVIAKLWLVQHSVMRHVVAGDTTVTRLLFAWLLLIVWLPFPTALVAEAGDEATTRILYIGAMALSAVCLAAISYRIARTPAIRDSDQVPDTAIAVATVAAFGIALAASLAIPALGYWPLLVLLLTDPAVRGLRSVRRTPRP
jgi:uncharacterized membrane protein